MIENELIERVILFEERLRKDRSASSPKKLVLIEGISQRLYELDSKTTSL